MSVGWKDVHGAWTRFWFAEESATNLAAARILLCGHSLWILASRDFAAISGSDPIWTTLSPAAAWRFLIVPGHPAVEAVLVGLTVICLVSALLGIFPRTACFAAGLLLYHIAPFETVFRNAAPYGRGLTLAPIGFLLLAASRCGDALSLTRASVPTSATSSGYGWALRGIQLLVCQVYLFSAYGKLVATGVSWGYADSMRRWFLWANIDPSASAFRAPGLWLAGQPDLILGALGLGTLLLEAGFIAVLFWRGLRAWVIPVVLCFNGALVLTINAHVPEVWLVLVFVDWSKLRPSHFSLPTRTAGSEA